MRRSFGVVACIVGLLSSVDGASAAAPRRHTSPRASAAAGAGDPPLAWEQGHPERRPWSRELLAQVRLRLASFDRAADIASFCPRYGSLSAAERSRVIATIAVGIARFESSYNPRLHYHEPPPL